MWNCVAFHRGAGADVSMVGVGSGVGPTQGQGQGPAVADERLPMSTFWPRRDSCCSGSCSGGGGPVGGPGGRCARCALNRCKRRCESWTECRAHCSKLLLVVVNLAFLVIGVMFVALSLLFYIDDDSKSYNDLLQIVPSSGPLVVLEKIPAIFCIIGLVVVLLSFLGCYGAYAESVCFLWLYTILLFLILAAQIVLGTLLALFREQIMKELETTMQYQIKHEYNKTGAPSNMTDAWTLRVTSVWDAMQIQLNCCGAKGPSDYRTSKWKNLTQNTRSGDREFVPASCCILQDSSGVRDGSKYASLTDGVHGGSYSDSGGGSVGGDSWLEAVLHDRKTRFDGCQIDAILQEPVSGFLKTTGCSQSALQRLSANTGGLFFIMLILTILQVVHFLFACSLLTRIRRSPSDYQWYEVDNCAT